MAGCTSKVDRHFQSKSMSVCVFWIFFCFPFFCFWNVLNLVLGLQNIHLILLVLHSNISFDSYCYLIIPIIDWPIIFLFLDCSTLLYFQLYHAPSTLFGRKKFISCFRKEVSPKSLLKLAFLISSLFQLLFSNLSSIEEPNQYLIEFFVQKMFVCQIVHP